MRRAASRTLDFDRGRSDLDVVGDVGKPAMTHTAADLRSNFVRHGYARSPTWREIANMTASHLRKGRAKRHAATGAATLIGERMLLNIFLQPEGPRLLARTLRLPATSPEYKKITARLAQMGAVEPKEQEQPGSQR